jgi:esterase/lipase
MKKKLVISTATILIALLLLSVGILIGYKERSYIRKIVTHIPFDDTRKGKWSEGFHIVNIQSTKDSSIQKAYAFQTTAKTPQPLIVSLHTWGGNYQQSGDLANLVKEKNWNYIHPDFRGPNKSIDACVSDLVIQDIDDAIDFALYNFNCDKEKIYVIGVSGGGHAALASFMKSKHNVAEFSAWCPISDIYWWYYQTKVRNLNYWEDILKCTDSPNGQLDEISAKLRSPLYWETPTQKLITTKLKIYAGVYDGIQGSVPITQSINFYNKILTDINCSDSSQYVNDSEIVHLLEKQTPLNNYGQIGNREIILKKEYKNISITIFDGKHELLTDIALQTLGK